MLLRGDTEALTALAVVRRVHRPCTLEHHPIRIATGDLLTGSQCFPPRREGRRAVQRDLGATVLGDVGRLVGFEPPTHFGSECAAEFATTRSGGCGGGYCCSRGRRGSGTRGRLATRSGRVVVVEGPIRSADCGDLAISAADSLRADLVVLATELGARVGVNSAVDRNFQRELTRVPFVGTEDDETVEDSIRLVAGVQMGCDASLGNLGEVSAQVLDRVRGLREVGAQPLALGLAGPGSARTGRTGRGASAGTRGTSGRTGGRATGRTRAARGAAGAAVTVVTRERDDGDDRHESDDAQDSNERPPVAAIAGRVLVAVVVRDLAAVAGGRLFRAVTTAVATPEEVPLGRGRLLGLGVIVVRVLAVILRRRLREFVGRLDRRDFVIDLLEQVLLVLLGDQAGGRVVFDADPCLPRVVGVLTPVLHGGIDASVVSTLVAAGIRPVGIGLVAHGTLLGSFFWRRLQLWGHLGLFRHFCRMFDGKLLDLGLGVAVGQFLFAELGQNDQERRLGYCRCCDACKPGDLADRLVAGDLVAREAQRDQHECGETLCLDFWLL